MSLWGFQQNSPTCNIILILFLSFYDQISIYVNSSKLAVRIKGDSRIGPHNMDILSVLYGTLLGDASLEKRGDGIRFSFYNEAFNSEYLLWLHAKISQLGYSTLTIPKIQTRLGIGGIIRYVIRFHSFSYASFIRIYESWYKEGVKRVPSDIEMYLTPLTLAVWIMGSGTRVSTGLKLSIPFSYSDTMILIQALHKVHGLHCSIQLSGYINKNKVDTYHIYIWAGSMVELREIVRPHMVSSMLYKLGE